MISSRFAIGLLAQDGIRNRLLLLYRQRLSRLPPNDIDRLARS
jgi:hypothetical protein